MATSTTDTDTDTEAPMAPSTTYNKAHRTITPVVETVDTNVTIEPHPTDDSRLIPTKPPMVATFSVESNVVTAPAAATNTKLPVSTVDADTDTNVLCFVARPDPPDPPDTVHCIPLYLSLTGLSPLLLH